MSDFLVGPSKKWEGGKQLFLSPIGTDITEWRKLINCNYIFRNVAVTAASLTSLLAQFTSEGVAISNPTRMLLITYQGIKIKNVESVRFTTVLVIQCTQSLTLQAP